MLLAADPVITEFVASNSGGILDGDGDASDWIEIFNPGDTSINLQGWHLTDDRSSLSKWTFPSAELEGGQFVVVFASGKNKTDGRGYLHTNFALSQSGEYLGLVRPDGATMRGSLVPRSPRNSRTYPTACCRPT